jgi:hypothetical protein
MVRTLSLADVRGNRGEPSFENHRHLWLEHEVLQMLEEIEENLLLTTIDIYG